VPITRLSDGGLVSPELIAGIQLHLPYR
jgi:hypothetical protein